MKKISFYSTSYCSLCKLLKPKVAEARPDTEFINLDDKQDLADALGIMSVPVVIFWDGDVELMRLTGGVTVQQFKEVCTKIGV